MKKTNIKIDDLFWSKYTTLVKDVVIPYQWDALNDNIADADPSGAIRNFRIAAGEEEGEFYGMVFQDSDVAKWLEAVAYRLETHPDSELEKTADGVIDLIGRAQQDDGYLDTYYIINGLENRWTNLHEAHELYCAGHMMEAAVAYYEVTGKRKLLDIMCRFADHIDTIFGPEKDKKKGYPGHQEIELALMRLYSVTQNKKYLDLAKYFLDERGRGPYYFDIEWEGRGKTSHWMGANSMAPSKNKGYNQAHLPVRDQATAEGHSVRAVYMYASMVDVAIETNDNELMEACKTLWDNIVSKRMYITGGIGSQVHGEAFSFDYDLPNDTVYAETCAAIGLIFFAQRMLKADPKATYADVMERALYNNVIAGISLDGKRFFYVNPLEVDPEACEKNGNMRHVKPVRQKWFACACCPPNLARLVASLGKYIYGVIDSTIYTHLYMSNSAELELDGEKVQITQETNYPLEGNIVATINMKKQKEFALALRIPNWSKNAKMTVNGKELELTNISIDGYAVIERLWEDGDKVELDLVMKPVRMSSNPLVKADIGKVAIQYGPMVYCLEEIDNGADLQSIVLPKDSALKVSYNPDLLGGVNVITAEGKKANENKWGQDLYRADNCTEYEPIELKFIPYYAWVNREPGEMTVWVREI
ncbi:MAG TPA: beta-L-arabinofuranosidase domain-containing protein [Clostridia bacterium]|nr:beta-L-arabinofuranosidase domain-containing protein [Clostridia bacterium]